MFATRGVNAYPKRQTKLKTRNKHFVFPNTMRTPCKVTLGELSRSWSMTRRHRRAAVRSRMHHRRIVGMFVACRGTHGAAAALLLEPHFACCIFDVAFRRRPAVGMFVSAAEASFWQQSARVSRVSDIFVCQDLVGKLGDGGVGTHCS